MAAVVLIALAGAGPAGAGSPPRLGQETPVTATDLRAKAANNTPAMAVDPTDGRFVALAHRLDAPDFSCALALSGDGGASWVRAKPVPRLPAGAEKCYAPEVAFDHTGRLYYLFVGLAGNGNSPMGVFLATSDDRGATFGRPRKVLGPFSFFVRMAIDRSMGERGRLHLVWLAASGQPGIGAMPPPPNPIMAAHSDDGGRSFSEPVQVSDPARQRVVAPSLALGPDHAIHVAYYDLGTDAVDYRGLEGPVWEGNWSVVVASSTDGGRRFGPGVVVDDDIVPTERVMLIFTMPAPALAAGGGAVVVAWPDARHGDWDVLARRSGDAGRSWSPPRRVNDDPKGNGRHQYMPQVGLASGGRVDVVFFDRRHDKENVCNHVMYASSDDGARGFAPNRRLTSEASDSRVGQRYVGAAAQGRFEIGSRLALVSQRSTALAAWPDARFSAPGTVRQDIVARAVAHGGRGGSPTWAWGALVLAALGALGGAVALRQRGRKRRQAVADGGDPAGGDPVAEAVVVRNDG